MINTTEMSGLAVGLPHLGLHLGPCNETNRCMALPFLYSLAVLLMSR